MMNIDKPDAEVSGALPRLEPLRYVRTDVLEVAYFDAGPSDGEVVLLLHGFPYDIHCYVDVIPRLVAAGRRYRALPAWTWVDPLSRQRTPRVRDSRRPSVST